MTNDISNTADIIDVRDIIARVEELRASIGDIVEGDPECVAGEKEELKKLEAVLEELKGNGGDKEWEGDWYPVTLISDSYFNDAMDEMLEDIGELKKFEDRPCYIKITVDYDALQMDYTSVEYEGVTYWYR